MHFNGSIAELSGQGDNFGNDQFRNTARVCEWGVEHGNTTASSIIEVDLVGSDTEASDDEQVLGLAQNLLAQLCLGADTNNMDLTSICQGQRRSIAVKDSCLPDFLNELILGKRSLQSFDLIALARENIPSGLVDILQQQDLDILGVEGLQDLGYALAR